MFKSTSLMTCHESYCCFVDFQYADFFRLRMPAALTLPLTDTTNQKYKPDAIFKKYVVMIHVLSCFLSFCFPLSVASMDEVIHSAPWRPWMKSFIVPAPLPMLLIYSRFFECRDFPLFVCICWRLRNRRRQGRNNPKVEGKVQKLPISCRQGPALDCHSV
jgi:hypothetical protein